MCGCWGACVVGGMHCRVGVRGSGHAWQGVCMAGRVCMAGGHMWHGGVHGRKNGNYSVRYASYWNAFLSYIFSLGAESLECTTICFSATPLI